MQKFSHYNTVYFLNIHTRIYEKFVYKQTETIEYLKN